MSYTDLLINTCTTQRFTEGAVDSYGNPIKTFTNHLVGIKCRWSTPKNTEIKIGAEIVIADLQLFLLDVDITEKDRVVLDSKTWEVISTFKRQDGIGSHHVEAMLKVVKS
ncbi:MAG: hypothetical protein Q8M94_08040 [Ignavibacteria bacterium]|nr:hypothetical protein [Ignavibacteria bacterium]